MRVEFLKEDRKTDFIEYCIKHRDNIDESYLDEEELNSFKPDEENPTYIVLNEDDQIIATSSLIIDEYNKRGNKARFRIFHSEIDDTKCYHLLMKSMLTHTKGLDNVYIFIPVNNNKLISYIEKLNFKVERFTFVLIKDDTKVIEETFLDDFSVQDFKPGKDEEVWANVRNEGFKNLKGNSTPITKEMVTQMISDSDYIDGGLKILYYKDKPIGVVRGTSDYTEDEPIMNIGPLAILPDYQGKGLGRNLLRTILRFANEKGFKKTMLCVNAENERAKSLYLNEGFKQLEAVVCYKYDL